MILPHRSRFLRGWYVAVAQNLAPKRFHARESRIHREAQLRLLAQCDLPLYGASGDWVASRRCHVTSGVGRHRHGGPLGPSRLHQDDFVAMEIQAVHSGPNQRLSVSSRRQRNGVSWPEDARWVEISNFLGSLRMAGDGGELSAQERKAADEARRALGGGPESRTHRIGEPAGATKPPREFSHDHRAAITWTPFEVPVDDQQVQFQRFSIGDRWLALGTVGAVDIAVVAHRVKASNLALSRIVEPEAWQADR
jgi:hypothetical protein